MTKVVTYPLLITVEGKAGQVGRYWDCLNEQKRQMHGVSSFTLGGKSEDGTRDRLKFHYFFDTKRGRRFANFVDRNLIQRRRAQYLGVNWDLSSAAIVKHDLVKPDAPKARFGFLSRAIQSVMPRQERM